MRFHLFERSNLDFLFIPKEVSVLPRSCDIKFISSNYVFPELFACYQTALEFFLKMRQNFEENLGHLLVTKVSAFFTKCFKQSEHAQYKLKTKPSS